MVFACLLLPIVCPVLVLVCPLKLYRKGTEKKVYCLLDISDSLPCFGPNVVLRFRIKGQRKLNRFIACLILPIVCLVLVLVWPLSFVEKGQRKLVDDLPAITGGLSCFDPSVAPWLQYTIRLVYPSQTAGNFTA